MIYYKRTYMPLSEFEELRVQSHSDFFNKKALEK